MSSEGPLQCRVLREHYHELVHCIQGPDSLADRMFSRELLGSEMMHELQVEGLSRPKKTRKILLAMQDLLTVHPDKFGEFVKAVRSESSNDYIADKLMRACVPKALGVQETLAELRRFYAWFPLGLCLGVPKEKLRAIYSDHGEGYDVVGRCMAKMIEAWLEMNKDANWPTLATALWQTGRKSLAKKIAEKFGFQDQFLRTSASIQVHDALGRKEGAEWRMELERLDQTLSREQQEFLDNEKEKQMIEKDLSDVEEHVEATGNYLQLLHLYEEKLISSLKKAEYSLEISLSVPTQSKQQVQHEKKAVLHLKKEKVDVAKKIDVTKKELDTDKKNIQQRTKKFSELLTRQKELQERKCVLLARLRRHEEALNGGMPGEPPVTPSQSEVSYYNIMTRAGKIEVKLRQSEIELIEHKVEQKDIEVSLLRNRLLQLENKVQKLEQHLRSQKTGDTEHSELELFRLQNEALLTRRRIFTAEFQKHQLQCEKKMQTEDIRSIQDKLSDENVEAAQEAVEKVVVHKTNEAQYSAELTVMKGEHLEILNRDGHFCTAKSSSGEQGCVLKDTVTSGVQASEHPHFRWYFGSISRFDSEKILSQVGIKPGTFLIRNSETSPDTYVLSVRNGDKVNHYRFKIDAAGHYIAFDLEVEVTFSTLEDLIYNYVPCAHGLCSHLMPSTPTDCTKNECETGLGFWRFGDEKSIWNGEKPVVVKTLKPEPMTIDVLSEAQSIKKLQHDNLIKLYAICTEGETNFIVTEFLEKGSLLNYLQSEEGCHLKLTELVKIAIQVVNGMMYLESQFYIHQELAARNVMIGKGNIAKIFIFGLIHVTENNFHITTEDMKLPIKWIAPEVVRDSCCSMKSSIWSFGILVSELITHGKEPYPGMTNEEALAAVQQGYRMPSPPDCPEMLYEIMLDCWTLTPDERPTFECLKRRLGNYVLSAGFVSR